MTPIVAALLAGTAVWLIVAVNARYRRIRRDMTLEQRRAMDAELRNDMRDFQ